MSFFFYFLSGGKYSACLCVSLFESSRHEVFNMFDELNGRDSVEKKVIQFIVNFQVSLCTIV